MIGLVAEIEALVRERDALKTQLESARALLEKVQTDFDGFFPRVGVRLDTIKDPLGYRGYLSFNAPRVMFLASDILAHYTRAPIDVFGEYVHTASMKFADEVWRQTYGAVREAAT